MLQKLALCRNHVVHRAECRKVLLFYACQDSVARFDHFAQKVYVSPFLGPHFKNNRLRVAGQVVVYVGRYAERRIERAGSAAGLVL